MESTVARASAEFRVVLEPRPAGNRATYIIKTRSGPELEALRRFFHGLNDLMEVRPLADGPVSAYAVQHFQPYRGAHAEIEALLRRHFEYVTCEPSVTGPVLDLIHSLCLETGSRELEVDRCGICSAPQPFPTTLLNVSRPGHPQTLRRVYCTPCIANVPATGNQDLVRALLAADSSRFDWVRGSQLTLDASAQLRGGRAAFRLTG